MDYTEIHQSLRVDCPDSSSGLRVRKHNSCSSKKETRVPRNMNATAKSSGVLPHVLTGGVRTLSLFPCDLWFQKRFPIADRNGEIRSAELAHHGEVNSYNLALVIEKWTARAARSGLRIVDDLVR